MTPPHTFANDLRVTIVRLSRRLRNNRADDTLSFPHFSALGSLLKAEPMTLQELADAEHITAPSMLKTVAALQEHGYIAKRPHETDGRKQLIEITPEGHAMLAETRRQRNAVLAEGIAALEPEERRALEAALPALAKLAG